MKPQRHPRDCQAECLDRTKDDGDRQVVCQRSEDIIKGICESYGATYDIEWVAGYGIVRNDEHLADIGLKAARTAIGESNASEVLAG